jgi:hypothetical protein
MTSLAIAERAYPEAAVRGDLMAPAAAALAEKVGHLSLANGGRAVFQNWLAPAKAKGWLPIRLHLHRGPDDTANLLGWGVCATAEEVWHCAADGTVLRHSLPRLRDAMRALMLTKGNTPCPDLVVHRADTGWTSVYRFLPVELARNARL